LSKNRIENISKNEGLCNNYIKSIIIDASSGVWLGTSNGICYLKPKNSNPTTLKDFSVKNYNRPEGYTGSTCLNNSIAIDQQQRIWIGTGRKLLCIDPSKERNNILAPSIKLKKINLFFEDVNWNKFQDSGLATFNRLEPWSDLPSGLVLPYNQNHLTFFFKGINLNCPEKTTYKFILEGLEDHWSPVSSENRATYSNIPPGKYTFKVIALNENVIPSETAAQFSFEIHPPWWQQTWFRIVAIVFLFLIVIIIIKLRERKLIKDKRILEATVRERTAEVVKQRDEILTKNEILNQQKEEIATQREIVVTQKEHIEEIHKEVTDSINYAERIQRSFLATKSLLDENLKNYFVFFKPKAVVSGDFYWASKINNGNFALATADSTGHGVPGAIMSILNISSLEKAVEQGICEPSEILNKTRKTIIERLKKDGSTEGGKDGMDASLICFDLSNHKIFHSAANNPIWIIRENNFIELNPDKMPIGKHDKDQIAFTQHEFQLEKGDVIYTFTDGLPDQFGGPKGKKFKYVQLKELFLSIHYKTMPEQKQAIEETFNKWKGDLEQVDDITVIGLKI
jgi:serine phosphatase RsbU (regulator of sigma subunit)